jgi:hypothetical protein
VTDSYAFDTSQFNADKLDFKGPCGVYYREIFFHAPFLIANALNAAGNFEAAQRWYQYIFDPTSSDTSTVVPASHGQDLVVDWVYTSSLGVSVPWSSL